LPVALIPEESHIAFVWFDMVYVGRWLDDTSLLALNAEGMLP
jgi:hypothetical protein